MATFILKGGGVVFIYLFIITLALLEEAEGYLPACEGGLRLLGLINSLELNA